MQLFPLRRLPVLAICEVIKSMDLIEIFLFTLASKKSQNLVILSIPKNSLFAGFIFREDGLLFELRPTGSPSEYIHVEILRNALYSVREEQSLMRVCSDEDYVQCYFSYDSGTSEVEDSTRKLFLSFSKTFKNTKIVMRFEDGTRAEFAKELIKFAWDNGFPLDTIEFRLRNASPESIRELLNGCHEHCTSLDIQTKGFKYLPPPGGYKMESFIVDSFSFNPIHWVNLDDFLQCRKVIFLRWSPFFTVEYLNGLLKKIVNLESRIESFDFMLKGIEPSDFAEIVKGLSESEIKQKGAWQGLQFKRKDGLKLLVTLFGRNLELEDDYL